MIRRPKSTALHVRLSNLPARNSVYNAASTSGVTFFYLDGSPRALPGARQSGGAHGPYLAPAAQASGYGHRVANVPCAQVRLRLPCPALQPEQRAYEVGIATQDPLDIVKTTLPTQYLSECSPGALVRPDQDMEKPRPGVEDVLQCTRPHEFWHNLYLDGGLVRQRRRIAATGYCEGFGGQIRAAQGIVNALTSKGF